MGLAPAIVCIGEMLWDVLPTGRRPGGAPFNAAVHLHQLGQPVQFISRVGDDELGRELLAFSTHNGISTHLIQRSRTHLTGVVKATARRSHGFVYKILKPVAWDYLQYSTEVQTAVSQARMVVYGSLAARNATSRETLYRLLLHAPYKVFDVNLRPPHYSREVVKYLLRQADLVKLKGEELVEIMGWLGQPATEETALPWLAERFGLQAVRVNKGAAGASLWMANQLFHSPGFATPGQETIGSGDAFLAALLASLLQGRAPADCLRRACAATALVGRHSASFSQLAEGEITDMVGAAAAGRAGAILPAPG